MNWTSAYVASGVVADLLDRISQELSLLEVAQLAPSTTASQTRHAISTMVFISFAQRFAHAGRLLEERDPTPARIDNFGSGKIDREEGSPQTKASRVEDKMRSLATERSKNSFRSGRFALDPSIKESPSASKDNSTKPKDPASFLISLYPQTDTDGVEENMRQAENERVALEDATRKKNEEDQRSREKSAAIGLRLIREKKPFTFDYEGASQGINPLHLPADAVRKMRQELRGGQVQKRDRMCETTQVANPKPKPELVRSLRGEGPVFSEKGFSVVEALGDDSHLAEGVKITELRGNSNNLTLEHRAKRPEGKPYRLKDYKNLSKDKSFREFPLPSRKNSLLDLSNSAENQQDEKIKTVRKERPSESRGRSQSLLKSQKAKAMEEALGRGLPFIRTKGLKFYDIGSGSSHKTIDFSFSSSERRPQWRSSKIKIPDASLYEELLLG